MHFKIHLLVKFLVGKRPSACHCTRPLLYNDFLFSGKFCILATNKNWLQMVLEGIFWENMGQFHHIMRKTRPILPYLNDKFSMSLTCNKIPSQIYSQIWLSPLLHGCQPTYLTNLKKKSIALTPFLTFYNWIVICFTCLVHHHYAFIIFGQAFFLSYPLFIENSYNFEIRSNIWNLANF